MRSASYIAAWRNCGTTFNEKETCWCRLVLVAECCFAFGKKYEVDQSEEEGAIHSSRHTLSYISVRSDFTSCSAVDLLNSTPAVAYSRSCERCQHV
jgi:hypothetical protein